MKIVKFGIGSFIEVIARDVIFPTELNLFHSEF